MSEPEETRTPSGESQKGGEDASLTLRAEDIFQGRSEVLIEFRGETYRLQITNRRRLILRK